MKSSSQRILKYQASAKGKICLCGKPAHTWKWGFVCKDCIDREESYRHDATSKSDCGRRLTTDSHRYTASDFCGPIRIKGMGFKEAY